MAQNYRKRDYFFIIMLLLIYLIEKNCWFILISLTCLFFHFWGRGNMFHHNAVSISSSLHHIIFAHSITDLKRLQLNCLKHAIQILRRLLSCFLQYMYRIRTKVLNSFICYNSIVLDSVLKNIPLSLTAHDPRAKEH